MKSRSLFIVTCVILVIFFIFWKCKSCNKKKESFEIAKRDSILCPIKEEKQYSILPPYYKVLIVQDQNYEDVPKFYRNGVRISPLKFSWNSDELTYYFVIQYLPDYSYKIRVSENVEPLITDGDGYRVPLRQIRNSKYYEYSLLF
jgi:hypothetical protein